MKIFLKPLLILLMLGLATLACSQATPLALSVPEESLGRDEEVATIVAATIAAAESESEGLLSSMGEGDNDSAAAPEATATPVPEPTATVNVVPPGLKVVYVDQGNLWLWIEGHGTTQLTTAGSVVDVNISEDGQVIAFVRQYEFTYEEIWAINTDGSDERLLVGRADFEAMPRSADFIITQRPFQIDWVPGTHTLAYNTNPAIEGPGLFINDDLHLVDADSGEKTTLLEAGWGGMFCYSPDGNYLAVVTSESLSIMDTNGKNRRDLLTFPIIYTYSEWAFHPEPVWTTDSSYLRVAIPPQDPMGNPSALTFVWHIPTDGSLPYMAGEFVAGPVFQGAPAISPDTRKVIYVAPIGETFEQLELHVLDLETATNTTYLTGQFYFENWNPDSQRFVYTGASVQELFVGQVGQNATRATDQVNAFGPKWADSEKLIFYTNPSESNFYLNIGPIGGPSSVIGGPFAEPGRFDFSQD